ncbi:MAG: DUF6529 family protein [Actinomycetota bacterium]|nr:DUF6529 family protein [Actinomycetota bacterium]
MVGTVPRKLTVPLAAFAAGSVVSLLIGVYGAQHEPTFRSINTFGFGSMIQMKVWFAVAVGALAIGQLIGALWLYGRLGVAAPAWLGKAHRASGTLAILLSLPVAFHCLWSLGFQSGENTTTRVMLHSIVGCAVYGALVVKIMAVRSKTAPGWLLPVAGGLLFSVLITVVWTSAIWYLGEVGLPKAGAY